MNRAIKSMKTITNAALANQGLFPMFVTCSCSKICLRNATRERQQRIVRRYWACLGNFVKLNTMTSTVRDNSLVVNLRMNFQNHMNY